MSTNRSLACSRSSPPIIILRNSEFITQGERQQVNDDILNRDPVDTASSGSLDQDDDTRVSASKLPIVISHHSNEGTDSLQAENPSDQDEPLPCLPNDIKRNKLAAMKVKFCQERELAVKGNLPKFDMSHQAGKRKGIRRVPRKRCRSYSCSYEVKEFSSKLEFKKDTNDAQQCLETDYENVNKGIKLPSIFERNTTNSRFCASASYAKIKHVHCAIDDTDNSNFKKRRDQQYTGIPDTLVDKDLRLKVKQFLQKPQPKASVSSLRIKNIPDVQLHADQKGNNHNTAIMKQFAGVPVNTDTCPLMSHFKDRKWYYQDKRGKCRYLRVPESPIPPISSVFTED